ncbi:MAG: hypothetical protein M3296_07280 [Actinomycetota bacterium]|nr:hypothetical protein [Actinomycetota bacterium]
MTAACTAVLAAALGAPAAQAGCKTGLTNRYENRFFVAQVVTNWCYSQGNVTSRRSLPRAWIKTLGMAGGWQEGAVDLAYTGCHRYHGYPKHNCLTRYQFSFWNVFVSPVFKVGVCVHTRVYGNGAHRRALTTNC